MELRAPCRYRRRHGWFVPRAGREWLASHADATCQTVGEREREQLVVVNSEEDAAAKGRRKCVAWNEERNTWGNQLVD